MSKNTELSEGCNDAEARMKRCEIKLCFEEEDLDYRLQVTIGKAAFGGSSLGELLSAASKVDEKNLNTWSAEMRALAARVESIAKDELEKNNTETAKSAFLRASTYYRAATATERVVDPLYLQDIKKNEECFQQFALLSNPVIEKIEIPYKGESLRGYFMRANEDNSRKPTLIMIGGSETFAEDSYIFGGAPMAAERGYNVVSVDLPGQGRAPFDGLYYQFDVETPVGKVIDYIISRPDVDPDRIVSYGISFGGYMVLRAAYDKRIAAIASSTPLLTYVPLFEANKAFRDNALKSNLTVPELFGPAMKKMVQPMTFERIVFGTLGPDAVAGDVFRKLEKFACDPKEITIPVLCIAGASEADELIEETKAAYSQFPNPKKELALYDAESGADAHCQVNNLLLGVGRVFDFFDRVLDRR